MGERIKKSLPVIAYVSLAVTLIGCAPLRSFTQPQSRIDNTAIRVHLPVYSGPKAHIAIADFDVKVMTTGVDIGSGLRQMLVVALINTNRFSVVERQALSTVSQEQEPSAAGKAKAADLIITGAITKFEPETSGGRAGLGGGGGIGSGILGGLLGANLNKAHIALDIRIIDAATSQVLSATRVQGQASEGTATINGVFGSRSLGAGLSVYANTAMEKAIRICIVEAVRYIYQTVPENYYKH